MNTVLTQFFTCVLWDFKNSLIELSQLKRKKSNTRAHSFRIFKNIGTIKLEGVV